MAFIYLVSHQRAAVKDMVVNGGYTPIIAYEDLPLNGEKVDLIYVDADCWVQRCKARFESNDLGRQQFIGETEPVKGCIMCNCIAWKHISY